MYKTILVPLDSSDFGEEALKTAASIARRAHAELNLATVEIAPAFFPDGYEAADAMDAARSYLEGVAAPLREKPGLTVSTEALTGDIAEALEDYRAETGADLVVMTTHGRGPLRRAWLGSAADAVLRRTTTPLLLIRPTEDGTPPAEGIDLERILIATDGSETSEAVLEPVIALGQLFGASYHVVRVVQYPHGPASVYIPHAAVENKAYLESAQAIAEKETAELVGRLRARDLNVRGSVNVATHVADGILATANEGDFDLIAIATHGRGGVRRMVLGSVADKVIRGAEQPVFVVRPRES